MPLRESFIVPMWAAIFGFLARLSLFSLARRIPAVKKMGHAFVDAWALGHLLLSVTALATALNTEAPWLLYTIGAYAFFRVFEVVTYQINVLLFDEYRAKMSRAEYKIRGYRRIVLLLLHNYVEMVFWFATAHALLIHDLDLTMDNAGALSLLKETVVVMVAYSSDALRPATTLGYAILTIQSVIGVLLTIIVLARFISILPTPDTMDDNEK